MKLVYTNFQIETHKDMIGREKKEGKMPVYSEDLRVKVVEFIKKGHTHREAAEVFGVSMKSICTWKKMDKEGKR